MRAALIVNDVVEQLDFTVIQLSADQIEAGWEMVGEDVAPGMIKQPDKSFVAPPADVEALRARASLSRMDFAIAAATAGFVTFEVAEDWAAGNSIPDEVATAIGALPAEEQGPARIVARCKDRIDRNGALMPIIAAAFGADDAALDALYGF